MADETTPEATPAFDPTALDDAALAAEVSRVEARGRELSAATAFAAGELDEFTALGEQLPALRAEVERRNAAVAAQQQIRDSFAVETPALAQAQPLAPVAAPVAPVEPAPVSPAPVVPSVSQMAAQTVVPVAAEPRRGSLITAHVGPNAGGFVGKAVGTEFAGTTEISQALIQNAQSFGSRGGAGRQAIAQFRRNRGAEFTIDTDNGAESMNVLRHARDEKRLHGGSLAKQWQHNVDQGMALTAAAGWCAPSQNDYDLCRNWSAGVGILDLPTVTVTRGGINYTDEPTFPEIYANAIAVGGGSNFLTEAQVIADTPKTCSEIPCPTFENRRLDVMALCIRVSFLQAAGYP